MVSRWLWPGNRTFLEVDSMVVTWWIVAFWRCVCVYNMCVINRRLHSLRLRSCLPQKSCYYWYIGKGKNNAYCCCALHQYCMKDICVRACRVCAKESANHNLMLHPILLSYSVTNKMFLKTKKQTNKWIMFIRKMYTHNKNNCIIRILQSQICMFTHAISIIYVYNEWQKSQNSD